MRCPSGGSWTGVTHWTRGCGARPGGRTGPWGARRRNAYLAAHGNCGVRPLLVRHHAVAKRDRTRRHETRRSAMAVIELGVTVLDCPDPRALAAFYAEMLGWRVAEDE